MLCEFRRKETEAEECGEARLGQAGGWRVIM